MNEFEIYCINQAFDKCYGLKEALKNKSIQQVAIDSLSEYSGLRLSFIKCHITQILEL